MKKALVQALSLTLLALAVFSLCHSLLGRYLGAMALEGRDHAYLEFRPALLKPEGEEWRLEGAFVGVSNDGTQKEEDPAVIHYRQGSDGGWKESRSQMNVFTFQPRTLLPAPNLAEAPAALLEGIKSAELPPHCREKALTAVLSDFELSRIRNAARAATYVHRSAQKPRLWCRMEGDLQGAWHFAGCACDENT